MFDNKKYDKCEQISSISNDALLIEFKNITDKLANIDNFLEHLVSVPNAIKWKKYIYNPNPEWWCIKIPAIRGHMSPNGYKDDFFTIISNNEEEISNFIFGQYKKLSKCMKKLRYTLQYYFHFNDEITAKNCLNYIKTDFCRCCYYLVKINSNVFNGGEFAHIPWFNFYNNNFNKLPKEIDDYLFTKYHISNDIRKHIEKILPDYYDIRKGRD